MPCPEQLEARKHALKQGLMQFALTHEPDLNTDELESYLSDGVDEAFAPILEMEMCDSVRITRREYRFQQRERALWRAGQL